MADERDDKIASLELALEATNKDLAETRLQLQQAGSLFGDLEQAKAANAELQEKLDAAKKAEAELRGAIATSNKSNISNLPKNAVQLARSIKVFDVSVKDGVEAKDGDILLAGTEKELKDLQGKIGSVSACRLVSAETLEEVKREGWHRK